MEIKVFKKDRKSVTLRFPFFNVQLSSLLKHMAELTSLKSTSIKLLKR